MEKKFIFFLIFIVLGNSRPVQSSCTLPAPSNFTISNVSCSGAFFSWSPVSGAASYKIRYRHGNAPWLSINVGSATSYQLTYSPVFVQGLEYEFTVRVFCSPNSFGGTTKIIPFIIPQPCAVPDMLTVSAIDTTMASIHWLNCGSTQSCIQYRVAGSEQWVHVNTSSTDYTLTGLLPATSYEYRINSCDTTIAALWSQVNVFTTAGGFVPPNILWVIFDDAAFKSFGCTGAPSFVHTPHIDQIAGEGVNFLNHYAVYSLCAPSRATMLTGRYVHGVIDNSSESLDPSIPLLPDILKSRYSDRRFIGKNQDVIDTVSNYFTHAFESNNNSSGWSWQGGKNKKVTYAKNCVIVRDTAVKWLQNSEDPFFMMVSFRDPHAPYDAGSTYQGLFDDEEINLSDTAARAIYYPSFLNEFSNANYLFGEEIPAMRRNYYEEIIELDDIIGEIYEALDNSGKLDNTCIIITSDNGLVLGEFGGYHGKRLAYESSARVALLMRYPLWFDAGSTVSSITANIDIPSTILHLAGIPDTFGMQGLSLKNVVDSVIVRDTLYGSTHYTTENNLEGIQPRLQFLVTDHYKYIHYDCNSTTEEFFNLSHDSLEQKNLINEPDCQAMIQEFRQKLEKAAILFGDKQEEPIMDCYLVNEQPRMFVNLPQSEAGNSIFIYPNPVSAHVNFDGVLGEIEILTALGRHVGYAASDFDASWLLPGIYFIRHSDTTGRVRYGRFVKQ